MSNMTKVAGAAALTFALAGFASPAQAEDTWQANHPHRTQVNSRLNNQNARINNGVKSGRLSQGQANQLHAEHHAIRAQERADAAQHGGHITKGEQNQLNHEENAESRQINAEKH